MLSFVLKMSGAATKFAPGAIATGSGSETLAETLEVLYTVTRIPKYPKKI
jgi:hypothetical protein